MAADFRFIPFPRLDANQRRLLHPKRRIYFRIRKIHRLLSCAASIRGSLIASRTLCTGKPTRQCTHSLFGSRIPHPASCRRRCPRRAQYAIRIRSTDLVLLTNGRGGMSRICVDLGRILSKYDCILSANLHPNVPVDRHVFAKRIRAWVNADGFISPLDYKNLGTFNPELPATWNLSPTPAMAAPFKSSSRPRCSLIQTPPSFVSAGLPPPTLPANNFQPARMSTLPFA